MTTAPYRSRSLERASHQQLGCSPANRTKERSNVLRNVLLARRKLKACRLRLTSMRATAAVK